MLAIIAPGQGAQAPGFLTPWLDVPHFADRLRWYSAVTGVDLVEAGTTAGEQTIRDTAVAQPLLVGAGIAASAALTALAGAAADIGESPQTRSDTARPSATSVRPVGVSVAAGHSVGEITAATIASLLSPETAMVFVSERGREMARAAAATATGMTAVLGGDPDEVLRKLGDHGLVAANVNGAGQVVAAGRLDALAALAADPPNGARLRPLSVAGAFHTPFMAPAARRLAAFSAAVPANDPRLLVLSNADGTVVRFGGEFVHRLVAQVSAPVRWDLCMATLKDLGVTAVIELPPAGTLTGLVKRALPGVRTLALKTPDDLPAAAALLAEYAETQAEPAPAWRVLVAPSAGTFAAREAEPGQAFAAGDDLGRVVARGREQRVATPYAGVLVEWLVTDGDPVSPGQPLARLHPEAVHA